MIRRAPLRRSGPLCRRTWLRARGRTSYRRRERDLEFMRWVRKLPCAVRAEAPDPRNAPTPCTGRVEADHMGERALGRKAEDTTCAPMCWRHHRERTDHSGSFRALTREDVRAWRARAIERTQAEWSQR